MTKFSFRLLAIGLAFLLGLKGGQYFTPDPSERYVRVVDKVMDSTVKIVVTYRVKDDLGVVHHLVLLGSGVFVSDNGDVLSCAHLFVFPDKIQSIVVVKNSNEAYGATLLTKSEKKDLSLLKISTFGEITPGVRLADPRSLKVGQEVVAIGSPLGLSGTVTTGVISVLHQDAIKYDMIQMSAPINPGNSGGPLFNLKGELVGINVLFMYYQVPTWSGIGMSVSTSEVIKFLTDYRKTYNLYEK